MKNRNLLLGAIIFIVGFLLGTFTNKHFNPCLELPTASVIYDTIVKRDTIVLAVPEPVKIEKVKVETVRPKIKPVDERTTGERTELPETGEIVETDAPTLTETGEIEIPIERKEYVSEDYKAVVEGWRASLVSIEVYPKTTTITETKTKLKSPRFSITAGPGIGYDGKKITPYVGVTAGLVLWSR